MDETGKQLRSVYFALVTTCFVLAVAATLAPNASIQEAVNELRDVKLVRAQLNQTVSEDNLLEASPVARAYWQRIRGSAEKDVGVCIRAGSYEAFADLSPGHLFWSNMAQAQGMLRAASQQSDINTTLGQVIAAWNYLHSAPFDVIADLKGEDVEVQIFTYYPGAVADDPVESTIRGTAVIGTKSESCPAADLGSIGQDLDNEVILITGRYRLKDAHLIEVEYRARIKTTVAPSGLNLLPIILDSLAPDIKNGFALRHRPFDRSFRNLASIAEGLESLNLHDLDDYLGRVLSEGGPQVSVFGAAIPLKAITNWGLGVLLAVQLYFYIHLRNLGPRISPEFPWIGAYRSDWLARSVYFVSVSALPVCAAFMLALRSSYEGSINSAPIYALALASLTVAILTLGCEMRTHQQGRKPS